MRKILFLIVVKRIFENNTKNYFFRSLLDPAGLLNLQTKNDGSADMRFNESKEAVNMGVIDRDETIKGGNAKK